VKTHRDSRGNIVRSVSFLVDEYIVGDGEREITIRLQGGVLDGIGRKVPGDVDLEPGEPALLFVERSRSDENDETAVFVVVGMRQGRFGVMRNGRTGERFITRTLGSLRLVGEVEDDSFGLGRADTCTFILFDTFAAAIRKLASEQRKSGRF
jgi:hypothetical protein